MPPSQRVQAQLLPPSQQAHGASHRRAIPRRPRDLPALRAAKQRSGFRATGPGFPLAPTTTFGGLNQAGLAATDNSAANQGTPPDTTGAIGTNHYVEFVNSKVRVFDAAALGAVSSADLDAFVGKSGDSVFDPQIQWDAQAGRWLYLADDEPSSGHFVVFGFSKTSDPSDLVNGWCRYSVSTGNDFNDYPKLGHNDNNMIFGTNVFGPVSFKNAAVWTAPKPAVGSTTCPGSVAATSFSLGSGVFTPVPANTSDGSANGYVVAASDPGSGTANHIGTWHVSGPASAPTVTSDGSMTVSSYSVPANVPQPGSADVIDSSDARLTQAVARADPDAAGAEAVWTQHTVAGNGGRSVVRWYELLPASLTVRQQGTIQDASNFEFNGAISPSGTGNEAVINYNVGSAGQLVQIRAQSRTSSAALGTMTGETTLGTSAAIDQDFSCPSVDSTQPSCRWGDYSGASPDPNNNNVVWGSSQLNGPVNGSNAAWTTRNFALDTTPPAPSTGSVTTPPATSGSSPPSFGSPPPRGSATTAPAVSASLFSQRLRTVLARGLVVYVRSDRIAKADVALIMGGSAARRIGISSASRDVVLGRVVKSVASGRRTRILVKLTRRARAALKRLSKVAVVLTVKVTDAAWKSTTVRRKLTLKR